jgi:hypothetical protein
MKATSAKINRRLDQAYQDLQEVEAMLTTQMETSTGTRLKALGKQRDQAKNARLWIGSVIGERRK